MCTIADTLWRCFSRIISILLHSPSRVSETCHGAGNHIFSVFIISVSQKWVKLNRICAALFKTEPLLPSVLGGNVCAAIGCLRVSFQHALSVETLLLCVWKLLLLLLLCCFIRMIIIANAQSVISWSGLFKLCVCTCFGLNSGRC